MSSDSKVNYYALLQLPIVKKLKNKNKSLKNEIKVLKNVILYMESRLSNEKCCNIKKEVIGEVVGFEKLDESEACEFVASITGDNSRKVVSFGTEAGLFQEIGMSTVVCGPGSIEQAHKIDEFIKLDELKKCLIFLEGVKDKSII